MWLAATNLFNRRGAHLLLELVLITVGFLVFQRAAIVNEDEGTGIVVGAAIGSDQTLELHGAWMIA